MFVYKTGNIQNPALVFIHGFLANHQDWLETIEQLKDDYYCLAIDLPGHGETGIDEQNNTMEQCAHQIDQVLTQEGIQRYHLVGYSMGGRVALFLARYYGEKVLSLVLEGSCPGLPSEEERLERVKNDEYIARRIEKEQDNFRGYLLKWYEQPFFKKVKQDPQLFEEFLKVRLKNDPLQVAQSLRCLGTGAQPSLWEELPEIKQNVWLVVGEKDDKFIGFAGKMQSLLPQAQLTVVPESGHNLHFEKNKEYVKLLKNFLTQVQR